MTLGIISPAISTPTRSLDSATRSAEGSPPLFTDVRDPDSAAHTAQDLQHACPGGVEADVLDFDAGVGMAAPGNEQKAAPLLSAGTRTSTGVSCERRTETSSPSTLRSAPIDAIIRSV